MRIVVPHESVVTTSTSAAGFLPGGWRVLIQVGSPPISGGAAGARSGQDARIGIDLFDQATITTQLYCIL